MNNRQKILFEDRVFYFEEMDFSNRDKIIDRDICKRNLLKLKKILDANDVEFGLIYGTLLGAIRENNFIEHDKDVDIYVLSENKKKVLKLLPILLENNLDIIRYDDNILSVMCDNDYIDIYFFREGDFFNRVCGYYSIPKKHFKKFEQISFLETTFNVPYKYKSLVKKIYGKNWITPIYGEHAKLDMRYTNLVQFIKKFLPYRVFLFFQKVFRSIKPIVKE